MITQLRSRSARILALALIFPLSLTSCRFYTAKPIDPPNEADIVKNVQMTNKYIIVHEGSFVWHLVNTHIDDSSNVITGYLGVLPPGHDYYKTVKGPRKPNQYKKVPKEQNPTFEVHLYLREPIERHSEQVKLTFDMIDKAVVYDRHIAATALSIFGISAGAFALIVGIVAATKSSCPLVYTLSDSTVVFAGETFGGAIYPALERDDYLPLPSLVADQGTYKILVSNKLQEVQYTNLASLIVVDHAPGTTAFMDSNGSVYTTRDPQLPLTAVSRGGADQFSRINMGDENAFSFEDRNVAPDEQALYLTFKRPPHALTARLILRLKNSFWFDYVYGQFNQLFGTGYNAFAQRQRNESKDKLTQWGIEQQIPLAVAVQEPSQWNTIKQLDCVGPLAHRNVAVKVDLTAARGDEVTIRLSTGFMFWEVDYVAMDFSTESDFDVHQLLPMTADDETGRDVRSSLLVTDKNYLVQPSIGNETKITYQVPETSKQFPQRSVFLHARGYYEYIRHFSHPPAIVRLLEFRKPGTLARLSRQRLDALGAERVVPAVLSTAF